MHGFLSIRGQRIEYASWPPGPPEGGPHDPAAILLLHEGLGSVAAWRSFPADLAAHTGRRVIAYSRRGYGASAPIALPRAVRFMHDEAIDELPLLLDALELERPVLLGHSDGGSIALIAAAHYPERIGALVLEAPHVFVEDVSIASIARIKTVYETTDLRARLARFHDDVDMAFRGWNDIWLDPAFRAWNIEALLPRVHCPTLVIQGDADEYGTLAQVDAITRQVAGRVETHIVPGCGHVPHHFHRDSVLGEIDRFLKTLPI